jgi:glutamine amidotransferase
VFFGPDYKLRGGAFLCGPGGLPQHVPQLGLPDPAADLRGLRTARDACRGGRLMCDSAYLGPPVPCGPAHDLPHGPPRSPAPRRQRHGTVNVDGFGVGWYAPGEPEPARYRRGGPVWADPSFADLARVTRSGAVLAAVRSATAGTEPGEAAAAPFAAGRWLFSHNGVLAGWPAAAAGLAAALPPADLIALPARSDSALLWALTAARLTAGATLGEALAGTLADLAAQRLEGRFNFLLTDGEAVAATAAGDTLCYRAGPGQVLVASEPGDDEPGWSEVPDGSLLEATAAGVRVTPLGAWPGGPGTTTETLTQAAGTGLAAANGRRSH